MSMLRQFWEGGPRRDPNTIAYVVLLVAAIFFPILVNVATGGNSSSIMTVAADAGVYVLLAIGLNVVVGFAGLLDLGSQFRHGAVLQRDRKARRTDAASVGGPHR